MSEPAKHANVYMALCAAQAEMGKLLKGTTNPHFKSRYAELADVTETVRKPFATHGLAYFHAIRNVEGLGVCMVTTLVHAESGTTIDCPVPLMGHKPDMQGFKSATTYAKRIGLESVSGLAPADDDDGNAAVGKDAAPVAVPMTREQFTTLDNLIDNTRTDAAKFCAHFGVAEIEDLTAAQAVQAIAMLQAKARKVAS